MQSLNDPLVTIHCVTYNHVKYLRQTLDSFLAQKTNFKFEIIIHDDASSDGTRQVIYEYQKKYPNIIRPFLEENNQFAQGNDDFIKKMFLKSKGKYIAQCEGDDYWTDENKLQKQVDFLEKNPQYALCFHPVKVFYENIDKESYLFPENISKKQMTLDELIKRNFIQSNSVLYRAVKYKSIQTHITPYDWYMLLYHAQFGEIGFINKTMSAYRRHDKGLWWNAQKDISKIWRKHGIGHLRLYQEMLNMFGKDISRKDVINEHIFTMINNIYQLEKADDLKEVVASEFPDMVKSYMNQIHKHYAKLEKRIQKLDTDIHNKNLEIIRLSHELGLIKGSKTWRIRNKLARVIGKEKV